MPIEFPPAGGSGSSTTFIDSTLYTTTASLGVVATVPIVVNTKMAIVVRLINSQQSGSGWYLIAGTGADVTDINNGILVPDDYNGSTNNKIWVRIFGL